MKNKYKSRHTKNNWQKIEISEVIKLFVFPGYKFYFFFFPDFALFIAKSLLKDQTVEYIQVDRGPYIRLKLNETLGPKSCFFTLQAPLAGPAAYTKYHPYYFYSKTLKSAIYQEKIICV